MWATLTPIIGQISGDGISASWVLVVMTGIAGTLFWLQLKDIKSALSDISKLVQLHDKQIAVLESKIEEEE